ncbi:MAG: hypothetical protein ACYCW6_31515 [Candidatus Xenobia bacterium]
MLEIPMWEIKRLLERCSMDPDFLGRLKQSPEYAACSAEELWGVDLLPMHRESGWGKVLAGRAREQAGAAGDHRAPDAGLRHPTPGCPMVPRHRRPADLRRARAERPRRPVTLGGQRPEYLWRLSGLLDEEPTPMAA